MSSRKETAAACHPDEIPSRLRHPALDLRPDGLPRLVRDLVDVRAASIVLVPIRSSMGRPWPTVPLLLIESAVRSLGGSSSASRA